eukprot:1569985-Amphidinium_carterae.2
MDVLLLIPAVVSEELLVDSDVGLVMGVVLFVSPVTEERSCSSCKVIVFVEVVLLVDVHVTIDVLRFMPTAVNEELFVNSELAGHGCIAAGVCCDRGTVLLLSQSCSAC